MDLDEEPVENYHYTRYLAIYGHLVGYPSADIRPGTPFEALPESCICYCVRHRKDVF